MADENAVLREMVESMKKNEAALIEKVGPHVPVSLI